MRNNTEVRTKNYYIDKNQDVWCFTSETNRCFVMPALASLKKAIPAHDEVLMQCTKDINALLRKAAASNTNKGVELHLLNTPRGLLLAWANCDGISGEDSAETISKAFGLK